MSEYNGEKPEATRTPLSISSTAFNPPLTLGQATQMQEFINAVILAAGWAEPEEDHTHEHPGISDEFWEMVPAKEREAFSAFLLKQARNAERVKASEHEGTLSETGGWCTPSEETTLAEEPYESDDKPLLSENIHATMAEEPIENRLRRAWLNGFKDGVERASYATTESTGRWDY